MSLRVSIAKRILEFNFDARTSRGAMSDKPSWFVRLEDETNPGVFGIGECGPLKGLSVDAVPDFEDRLFSIATEINTANRQRTDIPDCIPSDLPSVVFGFETALLDLRNGGRRVIYESDFLRGTPIPINGLIWMGDAEFMVDQIRQKIEAGFRCIKLKIGGLDFDRECDILSFIRSAYGEEDLVLRLDANGAFKTEDALSKLGELARFNIHSIEQPIRQGLDEMEEVCRKSPIPVAFDEELIGVNTGSARSALLSRLSPRYVVLKPTLHGGLSGCADWIAKADSRGIGWWITSALESSIGLNAICQFTALQNIDIPQGLGTGAIYSNNISSPLTVKDGSIFIDENRRWSIDLDWYTPG